MSMLARFSSTGGEPPVYVDDVFSTFLYTGNGSTQTITNGVDLAGKGGMVFQKARSVGSGVSFVYDTVRGAAKYLETISGSAQGDSSLTQLSSFNSNGFSLSSSTGNDSGINFVSWTFRKQKKFFDIVTYTGDDAGSGTPRTIDHNLGSTPGFIIVKSTSSGNWVVWHRSVGDTLYPLRLNTTNVVGDTGYPYGFIDSVTSTTFRLRPSSASGTGANDVNKPGINYVAYIFAHDAGGFGSSANDNVISCGSHDTSASASTWTSTTLGWEPQWILIKNTTTSGNWQLVDVMRRVDATGTVSSLFPNASTSEQSYATSVRINATGFEINSGFLGTSQTLVYVAIRRPNKPPTTGTSVFGMATSYSSDYVNVATGIVVDVGIQTWRNTGTDGQNLFATRLGGVLQTHSTSGGTGGSPKFDSMNGYTPNYANATTQLNPIAWTFRRAPEFFDVVYFSTTNGTYSGSHNLKAVPELLIFKSRAGTTGDWQVVSSYLTSAAYFLRLNSTIAQFNNTNTNYTATSTGFTIPSAGFINFSSDMAAYLFATCPGVSKVGSFTGNGSSQTINCGFAAGARFVLIKRTDSTGDWYVWDTARGIVSANDPHLSLNTTAAEVTTNDSIDPDSSGFVVNQNATTNINVNTATYLYLAIA